MPDVSPLAVVESGAQLADDVRVGPFSYVGPEVRLSAGCVLANNVTVTGRTSLGPRNVLFPMAVLSMWSLSGKVALLALVACDANNHLPLEPTLDPIAAKGNAVFQLHCATCHATTPNTVIVGPSLAGIVARAGTRTINLSAAEYIQLSILKPDEILVAGYDDAMPKDFGKKLTGAEFDAVVAYLMTLR